MHYDSAYRPICTLPIYNSDNAVRRLEPNFIQNDTIAPQNDTNMRKWTVDVRGLYIGHRTSVYL
jgi:hypothetical protein